MVVDDKTIIDTTPDSIKIVLDNNSVNKDNNNNEGNNQNDGNEPKVTIDSIEYLLDKDGNALDKDNKVFKTKDELTTLNTPATDTIINIDGVDYKADKDGNAVGTDGKVFKTKAELEQLSNADVKGIDEVQKLVGITINDAQGKPITYEDTLEGLANYTRDAARELANQAEAQRTNGFFQENPEFLEMYQYKRISGSLEGYKPATDYSGVEIVKDNAAQHEELIIAARMAKGDTIDEAKRFVQYSKDDKKLYDDAVASKKYLTDTKIAKDAAISEQLRQEELATAETNRQYWEGIQNKIVKESKLTLGNDTFVIPKAITIKQPDGKIITRTAEDFYNYLYQPISVKLTDGSTIQMTANELATEIERQSRTIDYDIFDGLRRFTGGDMTQFIKEQIKVEKANNIKKYITRVNLKSTDVTGKDGLGKDDKIILPIK